MIVGIGHDMTNLERIKAIAEGEAGERFLRRILTSAEQERAAGLGGVRRLEYIAGRFAAKEAVAKALGCGIGGSLSFQDIEIGRDDNGKPCATLAAGAWNKLGHDQGSTKIHVTITHERPFASAFVIVEN
ncbi:holo-[acyl-carrier protein] synthase [Paenibacillus phyllosphaerae]|uniref:Holo-[acyl-carrier-protein] synthase n=1 Tax=Paenibacillus phyllosphaerae TaxID=274593 RepID=A0A7W5FQ96_9BACL|nr:holo-[acyl-carrier protein] synthase [Paenibacillus phyllosphaerae]